MRCGFSRLLGLMTLAGAVACHSDLTLPESPATLTVAGAGVGSGRVTTTAGAQPTLDCMIKAGSADPAACQGVYAVGTSVSLAATPVAGSKFSGWAGSCSGPAGCSIALADSARVTATFDVERYTISVVGAGTGAGTVDGSGAVTPAIGCSISSGQGGGACSATYGMTAQTLTLSASAKQGSRFSGWGGDCTGTATCTVSLDRDHVVTAAFVPRRIIP